MDIPEGTPGVDPRGHPPRDEDGNICYPFTYEWRRPCPEHGLTRCMAVVFAFGKMSHRGECGHNWDRSGTLIGKWLDRKRWPNV